MKLFDFMTDKAICGDEFLAASWRPWRIVARLYDGDGALLNDEDRALACKLIGSDVLPDGPPQELVGAIGRRSGKSRFASIALTHAAAEDYRDQLAPGEWATVACIATDRRQARTIFGYCEGLIDSSDMLAAEVMHRTRDTIEFSHRSRLEIHTGSFRSVRGYTISLAVIDEAAFLRDERSATPDIELARALKPALATLNGRLIVISSPHRKVGLLWDRHRRYYGKVASRVLVIQAESRAMNPLLDQEMIDAELEADRESASSEWLGQFRSSTVQFLDDELIDAAIVSGRRELPFAGHAYFAFVDPSGGRHDAFTLSISHRDGERVVQDYLGITQVPFVPDEVVERYCEVLKSYGLASASGDRYGAEWVSSSFAAHGISYISSAKDKSAIYLESLPLFAAKTVELLDVQQLETELRLLERRPRAGGRGDLIDHPPRANDDAANAACGSLWLAGRELADDASQVLPSAWIRKAQERWEPEPPRGIPMCAIGVGIRGHRDPVIAVRHDGWFAPLIVVASTETPHGRDLAGLVIKHRRDEALPVIDVGEGLGDQTFAHLKENLIEAFPFRGHDDVCERTEGKQMGFVDKRSAAYWRFREALDPSQFQKSTIALPNDPELVAQLEAVKWEQTSSGIKVESKEKIEAKLLRPSNRADAVVMAWYKGARAMTHINEWRPDQRVGNFPRKRMPKVDMGPRYRNRRRIT